MRNEKIAYGIAAVLIIILYTGIAMESMAITLIGIGLLMSIPLASAVKNLFN
jgi:hypothetical protein